MSSFSQNVPFVYISFFSVISALCVLLADPTHTTPATSDTNFPSFVTRLIKMFEPEPRVHNYRWQIE